jgi:hypothetical protein
VLKSPSKLHQVQAPNSSQHPSTPAPVSGNQGKTPFIPSHQDPPIPESSAGLNPMPHPACTPCSPAIAKGPPLPKSNPLQGLGPPISAADHVANIMRGVLQPGSSDNAAQSQKSPPAAKPLVMSKKPKSTRAGEQTPRVHYNKLTASKRQEINEIAGAFYDSLSRYAEINGLNPVNVTRHALGGKLRGARMNCWKSFQLLSGMARNGRKSIQFY